MHDWPPACKNFVAYGLVAYGHVSGLTCGRTETAGPDEFRGSKPYQCVGIGIFLATLGLDTVITSQNLDIFVGFAVVAVMGFIV